jgi:predicted polyphosphate/ATP-dependent NAD kinase
VIANPVSARDIRRIVANAGNLQITDRVNIVLRLLAGAAAGGVKRALLMPDRGGIRALLERHLRRERESRLDAAQTAVYPAIEFLDMEPTSTVADTFLATRLLRQRGVAAIVVLGGDGTHRAVVRELVLGSADDGAGTRPPIAGLSTGTNNAFPELREPTITGLAVGLYAAGRVPADAVRQPNKLIEVSLEPKPGHASPAAAQRDIAIVDAVVTREHSIGARALWKAESLDSAYLAFADPQAIGLSAIGGLLQPVGRREAGGLAVQIAADARHALLDLQAPIAPGLVRPVPIAQWQRMVADEPLTVARRSGTVALDGERELPFDAGMQVRMTLREAAFFTIDVPRCMALAAQDGALRQAPRASPDDRPTGRPRADLDGACPTP